ncbi:MAG: hypothetical protein NC336_04320 [Clostridium sp.]|nr:hypothetical protein [Clostridium sp.]
MILKKTPVAAVILAATIVITSCSGGNKADDAQTAMDSTETVAESAPLPAQNVKAGDDQTLFADDLSPEQAAGILYGFYDLYNQQISSGNHRGAMATMRDFVDIYDIVRGNHGDKFLAAASRPDNNHPDTDLQEVYSRFQERLSQYDGYGPAAPSEESDSTGTDSVAAQPSDELPPELRPAE